jgi:PAS domain S-box-containing protein
VTAALKKTSPEPAWTEQERLAALRGYGILDTPPEPAFDEITRVAALVCRAPIAVVNLIEDTRQFFKSEIGLGVRETPVDVSICAHAILQRDLFVVPTPPRPTLCLQSAHHRRAAPAFLCGCPLGDPRGSAARHGLLLDYKPRPEGITPEQGEVLRALARAAMAQIELGRSNRSLAESEAKFRVITDSVDQMIWSTRPDGYHDFYNQRWYSYTGVPEGSTDGEGWNDIFHPDDQERAWATWRHSLNSGEPYHVEYRLRHRSGQYRWVLGRAQPMRDERGQITRWFGTCTDIHDRKQADEANARLAAIVSSSPDAIISFAAEDGRILTWNKGAEETFGYTAEEAIGAPVDLLVPHDMLTPEENATGVFHAAMLRGSVRLESRRRCKDGRIIHVSVTATQMKDETGKVLGVSGIFRDITDRKSAEERQHFLTRELHHRIKNTLATVQAIARSTARSVSSIEEFSTRFTDRLISMGRAHTLVTENEWQGASLGDLLRLELAPYDDGSSNRIKLLGPEVYLPPDTALALGLGIHELTTNAAKHGALSVSGGEVEVAWSRRMDDGGERLSLTWAERDGPAVTPPAKRGFGSQLLQRVLGTQVDGTVSMDYAPAGLQVEIDLPLKS